MTDETITDDTADAADAAEQETTQGAGADAASEAKDEKAGTLLEGAEHGDPAKPQDWPEDWRDKLAAGDEKLKGRLDRFKSPQDILKSYTALEAKLSSGKVKEDLPDDATEEQVAEYRKANGIPETPDGYLEALPDGLVIGDEDKDMVAAFAESAHKMNADPKFVASAINWYQETKEQQIAAQAEADRDFAAKAADTLRAEWGSEFRANLQAAKNFVEAAPVDDDGTPLKDLLFNARLGDGTPLGNNPAVLKWLAQMANDANPAGFVSPAQGGNQAQSVSDEIASIEKTMREKPNEYWKDKSMQDRLQKLYDAQERLGAA